MTTRKINQIIIHCSASPSGQALQQGTYGRPGYLNAAKVINAWHAARGFKRELGARRVFNADLSCIGYHFVLDLNGAIFVGRSLEEVGAHAVGHNANSIGICLVGGAEREGRYTGAQWQALRNLAQELGEKFGIPLTACTVDATGPSKGICGHRDLSPDTNHNGKVEPTEWLKTCPGFDVATWLQRGLVPEQKNIFIEGGA
jgi:N-acetylmuramoyl-L-alanine amidase